MGALNTGVIIRGKVAKAPLSYLHYDSSGGAGSKRAVLFVFSANPVTFLFSFMFLTLCHLFPLQPLHLMPARRSHFLDILCPTSRYLHLWHFSGSQAKAAVRLFKSCPSKWWDLSKSSAVRSVVCVCVYTDTLNHRCKMTAKHKNRHHACGILFTFMLLGCSCSFTYFYRFQQ